MKNLRLPGLLQLKVDGGNMKKFYLSDLHSLPQLCVLSVGNHAIRKFYCCSRTSYEQSAQAVYADFFQEVKTSIPCMRQKLG
jgi:hypothetical protein